MGQQTFDTMMHIISKGYEVSFSKSSLLGKVLHIELRKDGKKQGVYADITIHSFVTLSTDEIVARALRHALFEFEYQHEKGETE